ncbi:MAG: hypothetical protein JNJ98_19780 [Gemmatimonadetes bacterium]|nr:hypothetical protein [Gemmatimonadota bacterium]
MPLPASGWVMVLGLAIAVGLGLALRALMKRRQGRPRAFGQPVERDRDVGRTDLLRHARAGLEPQAYHDEQVWRDLDLTLVLGGLDRTHSWIGLQCLRDRLSRRDASAADLRALDAEASFMVDAAARRAWYADRLDPLGEWSAGALAGLFWGALPPTPWFRPWLLVLSWAMVAALVATVLKPAWFVLIIAVASVNLAVKSVLKQRIEPWLPAMRSLPDFLRVTTTFAHADDTALAGPLDELRAASPTIRSLRGAVRWARLDAGGDSAIAGTAAEFSQVMHEFLNLAFLLDVNGFYSVARRLDRDREMIRRAFLAIGRIDMAISLASVRVSTTWTRPAPGSPRTLRVQGLVHPLVAEPVGTDAVIADRSWLVTGSNMSGKSTFLRALGVGAVMAQSLGMVFARRWEGPSVRVLTSIGRSDAVAEGTSYYLAEVERIKVLLDAAAAADPCLFLLDELYRGTNTPERVAAALAVLEHLDRAPHVVVVATHDLELLHWLAGRYESWHFREEVTSGGLTFDYRLRPGGSSTRNALALLEVMGYPAPLVARSREVVGQPPPQVVSGRSVTGAADGAGSGGQSPPPASRASNSSTDA